MYNVGVMLLLIHVALALSSLAVATSALVAPSRFKIRTNYFLAAATLISGTFLVLQAHAPLVSACMSGLVYVSFVLAMTYAARRRLDKTD